MIQWEYLQCCEREFYDWKTSDIDPKIISDHKSFTDYLNHLGGSGWELVHCQTSASNQDRWIFKRPKESQHYRQ